MTNSIMRMMVVYFTTALHSDMSTKEHMSANDDIDVARNTA